MKNNIFAIIYTCLLAFSLYLSVLTGFPYFIYFLLLPIALILIILPLCLKLFELLFGNKRQKRVREEYLKEEEQRKKIRELEMKKNREEWKRLSQIEKIKILKEHNETEYSDRFWQNHKQYKAITEEREKWRIDEWNRTYQAEKEEILNGENKKKYDYGILISKKADKEIKRIIDEVSKYPVHLQENNADRLWREYLKKLVYEKRREESQYAAINLRWKEYKKKLDEEKEIRKKCSLLEPKLNGNTSSSLKQKSMSVLLPKAYLVICETKEETDIVASYIVEEGYNENTYFKYVVQHNGSIKSKGFGGHLWNKLDLEIKYFPRFTFKQWKGLRDNINIYLNLDNYK